MAEGQYDISVERWSCTVSNSHRKIYGDRKIRQQTVMRLQGTLRGAQERTAAVYLTFERGARDLAPTITTTDDPQEHVRVDAYLVHGQEAVALAILQSGFQVWARFNENALGQAAFTLGSGPKPSMRTEPSPSGRPVGTAADSHGANLSAGATAAQRGPVTS